jgi:hypothetical protein
MARERRSPNQWFPNTSTLLPANPKSLTPLFHHLIQTPTSTSLNHSPWLIPLPIAAQSYLPRQVIPLGQQDLAPTIGALYARSTHLHE